MGGRLKLDGAYFVKNVLYIIPKLLQASSHHLKKKKVVFVKRNLELHRRRASEGGKQKNNLVP